MGADEAGGTTGLAYLDAMKGVMSSSRGKETYVVIFRRSLAECSNRWWGGQRGEEEGGERGGEEKRRGGGWAEKWNGKGIIISHLRTQYSQRNSRKADFSTLAVAHLHINNKITTGWVLFFIGDNLLAACFAEYHKYMMGPPILL